MVKATLDTSGEFLFQTYKNGIRLLNPDVVLKGNNSSSFNYSKAVTEILHLPINVYFLDKNSIIQNINETTIITCGYPSVKNTIGKTGHLAAKREVAEKLIKDNCKVITSNEMCIFEENFIRLDEISFPAISFKFPWYHINGKIIGIFGCSIILNKNNLNEFTNSIMLLVKLGLLASHANTTNHLTFLPGQQINGIYLSERESQCLYFLSRGNTAKMIGKILSLSPRTVEYYIENIKAKLNIHSKAELIEKYMSL